MYAQTNFFDENWDVKKGGGRGFQLNVKMTLSVQKPVWRCPLIRRVNDDWIDSHSLVHLTVEELASTKDTLGLYQLEPEEELEQASCIPEDLAAIYNIFGNTWRNNTIVDIIRLAKRSPHICISSRLWCIYMSRKNTWFRCHMRGCNLRARIWCWNEHVLTSTMVDDGKTTLEKYLQNARF